MKKFWLKNKEKIILIAILLLAFGLRIWGINWGLPQIYHTDESLIAYKAKMILKDGGASIKDSYFGLFHYCLAALLYLFWVIVGPFLGHFSSPIDVPIPDFVLFGRVLSVLISTTSVLFTYRLAKLLYGKAVGLLASAILAVTFIDVLIAHYFKQDVYIQLLTLLILYFSIRILLRAKRRDYLFAGFFIGLATAFKANSAISVIPFFVAHVISRRKKKSTWAKEILFNPNLIVGMSLVLLGVVALIAPFYLGLGGPRVSLLNIREIFQGYWAGSSQVVASSANGIPSFAWWPIYLAASGLFYPLFFVCLGGLISSLKRRTEKEFILLSLLFPYYFLLAIKDVRFDRWITLVTPILAILGALFIQHCVDAFKFSRRIKGLLLAIFLIIVLGTSGWRIILFDYSLSQKDTRQLAQEWLVTHYHQDQIIFAIGDTDDIGHFLQKQGFSKVTNLFPLESKEIFLYPDEVLLIDSEDFHVAENYKNTEEYKKIWENYQLIKKRGELVKEFSQPLFKAEFFSPAFLEHSSTVNAYHNPTVEIYRVPKLDEYAAEEVSFEYLPEEMNYNMQLIERDNQRFLFKELEKGGVVTGPHKLFPKGDYLLEYFIVSPRCHLQDAIITLQVNPSGQTQYFAQNKFVCTSLGEYNKLTLRFRLENPNRLELVLEAKEGISFFVEKAVLKRTNYD